MSGLFPATVIEKQSAAEAQVFLRIDVPKEVWSEHVWPSQYVDLALPDMERWKGTIANRPGYEFFEFLVKDAGDRSHRIASLEPGDEIRVSLPKGEGFPILANRRQNIIMAASGVAICAMRPLIQTILLARCDWLRVMVFYGERTADRFAFIEEREVWREYGIEVFLSASRPSEGTYFKGHTGYVQENILELVTDPLDTAVFLAGKDEMIDGCIHMLDRIGFLQRNIFLNI